MLYRIGTIIELAILASGVVGWVGIIYMVVKNVA